MSYFICSNCHYLFTGNILPEKCPKCGCKELPGIARDNICFTFPSVREATQAEITSYEASLKEETDTADMLTWVDRLENYELSDDEYHMALILLYTFRNSPGFYTFQALLPLISINKSDHSDYDITEQRLDTYKMYKKGFVSSINTERSSVGTKNIDEVAGYLGNTSAAYILLQFRTDPLDEVFGRVPNLGNIHRIDMKSVASSPGEGYLHFLRDWYNSLDKTSPNDIIPFGDNR